jgi:hypothetical protein
MRKVATTALLTALFTALVLAQKQMPWNEWTEKEAEKMLNDSAWGQTQVDTNTAEMTYSPTTGSSGGSGGRAAPPTVPGMREEQGRVNRNRASEGAYNQAVDIKFRVRFLSAKPIREAFASIILLQQERPDAEHQQKADEFKVQMQQFVDRDFKDYIVLAVTFEASDGRLMGKAFQDFNGATTATIKNNTYLERSDGQRLFLIDYRPPAADGLGARFVFPRILAGHAFLGADHHEVRFHSEVGSDVKLDRRFKVSDMVYEGKLEY